MYIDEDTWVLMLADIYDGRGNLWRAHMATQKNHYEVPAGIQRIWMYYDLQTTTYGANILLNDSKEYLEIDVDIPDKIFKPVELRRRGRR